MKYVVELTYTYEITADNRAEALKKAYEKLQLDMIQNYDAYEVIIEELEYAK